jgi:prevent-host-death family protein
MKEVTVAASEFKAHFAEMLRKVSKRQMRVVVTRRGKPVARIEPPDDKPLNIHGWLKGTVTVTGDLTEPFENEWEVLKD